MQQPTLKYAAPPPIRGPLDGTKQTNEISKTKKKQHVNISIPNEVVVKILQRVPCQDLRETLKKVCMQWCSIIYSGSFAYSHVERGISKSSSFSQLEVVVIDKANDPRSMTVSTLEWHSSLPLQENWETKYMFTLTDVLDEYSTDMIVMNSVNGFFCFWNCGACLLICNPMTKEYFRTPPYTYGGSLSAAAVGLGFCQHSYEYKVIVLREDGAGLETRPLLVTVGIDRSWRYLKAIPDRKFLSCVEKGAHVKGVLYWYMESCTLKDWPNHSKTTKSLICFDVSREEVAMIMVPAEVDSVGGGRYVTRIAEKGGNLCLINVSYGPICSLLMKVYIAETSSDLSSINSWKKDLIVSVPNMAYGIDMTWSVVSTVTDEMLVIRIIGEDEIFIDVATGMLLCVFSLRDSAIAIPYVPSLVSLRHCPR